MQHQKGSILGASLLVPILLAMNVAPLRANAVEFNYGSFLAVYGSDTEGPVSPTSVTVTPDGLSVTINSGTPLFSADSETQSVIQESPFLASFWHPMWQPTPQANSAALYDRFLSTPSSEDVTLGKTALGNTGFGNTGLGFTSGGIGALDTVSDIDSIPDIVPASTATPEPSMLGLLAISLGFLMLLRRICASARAGSL
jgi:hypothetical protein